MEAGWLEGSVLNHLSPFYRASNWTTSGARQSDRPSRPSSASCLRWLQSSCPPRAPHSLRFALCLNMILQPHSVHRIGSGWVRGGEIQGRRESCVSWKTRSVYGDPPVVVVVVPVAVPVVRSTFWTDVVALPAVCGGDWCMG